jgi:hypothetical protein
MAPALECTGFAAIGTPVAEVGRPTRPPKGRGPRTTGSVHRSPIDATPRAPSVADEPRCGLDVRPDLRSALRIGRTTGRSCERRTNQSDPLGSRPWNDDLLGYGPTDGWQSQFHSRRLTFGARASPDDDSHSTEDQNGANRLRSPVGRPWAPQEPIAVNAGGHLRDAL